MNERKGIERVRGMGWARGYNVPGFQKVNVTDTQEVAVTDFQEVEVTK